MFIGRRPDGSIYGMWTTRQPDDADHPNVEEVADDHPDIAAVHAAQEARLKSSGNALASAERSRKAAIEEIERRLSLGAPAEEVLADVLKLLKE